MPRLDLKFHPAAADELVAAHVWYAERSVKAADGFLFEVDNALAQIQASPECGGAYLHNTRCYLLRRFPYLIVYRTVAMELQVVAVAHGRRRPGYWKSRSM